jgi:hypothetical protein
MARNLVYQSVDFPCQNPFVNAKKMQRSYLRTPSKPGKGGRRRRKEEERSGEGKVSGGRKERRKIGR